MPVLDELRPGWNDHVEDDISEKIKWLNGDFHVENVFPWRNHLSSDVNLVGFTHSFFSQPLLFLRVRPGKHEQVARKLSGQKYQWTGENSLSMENTTNLQQLLEINAEVVIQDISSQQVGELMQQAALPPLPLIWDCCAASGGKSILAADLFHQSELTVSDIRPGILSNLRQRMKEAGLTARESLVLDLTDPDAKLPAKIFDLVIADVPCSGSGTWGRTPEQLYHFNEEKIEYYAAMQAKILENAARRVKPGGYLLYCTCSVFRAENEQQLEKFLRTNSFEKIAEKLISGYERRSDTLYAALLRKTSEV